MVMKEKFFYYKKATEELTQCPDYEGFGKILGKRVYNDLMYLTILP